MPRAPPVTTAVRPFRSMVFMRAAAATVAFLEFDAVGAFEPERLPRLVGGGDLIAELFDDAADFCHLLGVAGGELAGPDVEAVFQADAHVAAHHGGVGAEIHLM